MAKKWKIKIGYKQDELIAGRICIDHFTENDFKTVNDRIYLKSNVVPSIFEEYLETSSGSCSSEEPPKKLFHREVNYLSSKENMDIDRAKNIEISKLKREIEVQEQIYKTKINYLESKLKINKKQLSISRSKVFHSRAAEEKLKKIINELSEKNLVFEKFADTIQVEKIYTYITIYTLLV